MYKSIHTRQYATLQDLLRQERLAAGLTQAQLAQRLQWNQADISKVETGVRRLDVIELRTWLAALGLGLPAFVDRLEAQLHVPTVQLTVLARQGQKPRGSPPSKLSEPAPSTPDEP
ncbi:MAG: helix-turn-helix transcriptional regulator [Brachymonas sp.]|nr:helix-turn-helix transcriptional regulator [Brachymonas sp.]